MQFFKRLTTIITAVALVLGTSFLVQHDTVSASATIAFDAKSETLATNFPSSLSVNHTTSGSDRFLVVWAWTGTGSEALTTATYNGVSMTPLMTLTPADAVVNNIKMWYLANPAVGTHPITVSKAGTSNRYIWIRATSYTGVNQTTPIGATTTNSGAGVTSLATPITTLADNSWVVAGAVYDTIASNSTAGSGTTLRTNGGNQWADAFDSGSAVTPAGSKTININRGNSDAIYVLQAEIVDVTESLPSGGGGVTTPRTHVTPFF